MEGIKDFFGKIADHFSSDEKGTGWGAIIGTLLTMVLGFFAGGLPGLLLAAIGAATLTAFLANFPTFLTSFLSPT